jgi:hypothetical protein
MRSLAALTLLMMTFAASADSADDVRRLDLEISVATWTGDTVWFEENLSSDYVMITPTGAARTKREIIAELAMPGLKIEPYDPTEVQVRMYGDSAVVTGHIVQRFTLGNARYTNDRRYTNVYVRKKARWLLVSGHASSVRR